MLANQINTLYNCEWDHLATAAGALTLALYDFFTVPQGGAKLKNQTSMEFARQFKHPEWMNVWSLGFWFGTAMDPIDINQFLLNYWVEFKVNGAIQWQSPLYLLPSGAGVTGLTTVAATSILGLGQPNKFSMVDFRLPPPIGDGLSGILILQGQSFNVEVRGIPFALAAAPSPGLLLDCLLLGPKNYGVQGGM